MNKVKSKYLKKCRGVLALLCAVYLASAGLVPAFTMESTEAKDKTTIQWENQSDVESLEGASEIESEDYVEFDWSDKAYDDSNASVTGDIQENETDEGGSVADAKSLQLAIAAAMTGVIGVTAMNNVKKREEAEVGTGVEGGLWTPENYRDQVLALINKISKTQYTFSESGYLIRDVNKEDVEGKSASYSKLIDKIIGAGNTVVIGIGDTYNTIEGQMAFEETSESQGVSIGDNLTDQVVIISGQSGQLEDVKGKAIYDGPELALAHELAHAARGVYGLRSTDLSEDEIEMDEEAAAISFENIVRHELGYGLRGDGSTESDANGDGIADGDGSYGEFIEDSDDWFEEIEVVEGAMLSGGFFNFRSKSKKRRDKEKRDKKRRDKKRDKRERERKRESKKILDKVKKSIKEKNDRTRKERDKKKRDKDRKSSSSSKKSNNSSSYDTGKKLYDKAKTDYANAKTDKAKAEAKARMDGLEKHLGIKNDKKTSTSSPTKNDKKSSGSSSKSHTSSKTSEVDKRAAQLVKAVENWDKSDASFKASVLEYNREINKYKNAKTDKERNDALHAMNGMNKRMDVNEKRKREHAEKEKIKNVVRQVEKIVPVNAAPPSAQETLSKEMLALLTNPHVVSIIKKLPTLSNTEALRLIIFSLFRYHSDKNKALKAAEKMGSKYKAAAEAYYNLHGVPSDTAGIANVNGGGKDTDGEGTGKDYYLNKNILISIGYDESILDDNFMNGLDETIRKYIIDESLASSTNSARVAHFLAQISHESEYGKWKVELADIDYMNRAYGTAGTKDSKMGDIVNEKNGLRRYCGAGYIQLSTRTNYKNFAESMGDPKILEEGVYYVAKNYSWQATGWWWDNNNMNDFIDSGHSVKEVSIRVNGGTNGLQDRIDAYNKIVEYLK